MPFGPESCCWNRAGFRESNVRGVQARANGELDSETLRCGDALELLTPQLDRNRLRILHVIPGVEARYGGPSAVIRALCTALVANGEVDVHLATTAEQRRGQPATDATELSDWPCPAFAFPRTGGERWKRSPGLKKWLRANVAQYDAIHVHALWSYASQAAARAAVRAGVPVIIRPAGMLSQYTFAHGRWTKWAYWNLIEKRTVFSAAAFHATSSQERADILRVRPSAQVHVHANGVDERGFSRIASSSVGAGPGTATDPRPYRFLFLSRLHPKKGLLDLLLPVFEQLPAHSHLTIVGGGDSHAPEYAAEVQRRIAGSPARSRIELIGGVSPDTRWEWYDRSDCFVLPSHSENFGVVVGEAMARGRPVVVSDQVQSCEHVAAAGAGWVLPRTIPEWTRVLANLVQNPESGTAAGVRGRAWAEQKFSWPQIARDIARMYQHVCGSDRAK